MSSNNKDDMVTCPRCNGKKYIFPAFPSKKMAGILKDVVSKPFICQNCNGNGSISKEGMISRLFICQNCNGNGSISKEKLRWIEEGEIIKNRRIEKRITLINAVKITNLSLSTLSEMERGIIKPDLSILYPLSRETTN